MNLYDKTKEALKNERPFDFLKVLKEAGFDPKDVRLTTWSSGALVFGSKRRTTPRA